MRYLRFGQIPESGRSVNFLKMSFEEQEDFNWFRKNGDIERAFSCVPDNAYELGVSVFEMNDEGMPILQNLQLVNSLLFRLDNVIYEVTGEEVAKGNDDEPLIANIKIEKKRYIKKEKLLDLVLSILLTNFRNAKYNKEDDFGENRISEFHLEQKVNKKTGEKVQIWEETEGSDWVPVPLVKEYTFNGWTFSNPVSSFSVNLGIKRDTAEKKRINPMIRSKVR